MQGRSGEEKDLIWKSDETHLRTALRDQLSEPQQAEGSVAAERCEIR